ncbi:hypothetical protein FDENT_8493 [Fusarium denticulatum]|uniref:Uncharacterized protein n=1 Tax=Fusarium denticulatum TaxID=48507 RepID=A0A8H5TXQ8_9HYPO|nr:hypothetical protein FDENT_8493 [Fusarium denticulatum]
MPLKMPRLDDLLALLEVYFAPERGCLQEGRRPWQSLRRKVVFRYYPLLLPISSSSPPPPDSRRRRIRRRPGRIGRLLSSSPS